MLFDMCVIVVGGKTQRKHMGANPFVVKKCQICFDMFVIVVEKSKLFSTLIHLLFKKSDVVRHV